MVFVILLLVTFEIRDYLRKWLRGRASPCQGEGRGFESRLPLHVPLAQLDRAFDYESKGREFESLRARHL